MTEIKEVRLKIDLLSSHILMQMFVLIRYIPSNFARREKRSLLDKIISRRIAKKPIIANGHYVENNERSISSALVKFRYDAER